MPIEFTDKYSTRICLDEDRIRISRPEQKYGHGYSRCIPYSSIKNTSWVDPTFFNYGCFSLITLGSGVSFYNMKGQNLVAAVEDETTFLFDKELSSAAKLCLTEIKRRMSGVAYTAQTLDEFWGTTFKGDKKTATLQPQGIVYNGGAYVLPYTDVLHIECKKDAWGSEIVILKKGLDEKIWLREYKKSHAVPKDDAAYCFTDYSHLPWSESFFKSLQIVMDNKHLTGMASAYREDTPPTPASYDGYEFEEYCAALLKKNGFISVEVTPKSGDQGVDILASKGGVKYALQCKHYTSPVGNKAVQEVNAGKAFYRYHVAVVLTDSVFSASAEELAAATGVLLWGKDVLCRLEAGTF